MTTVIFTFISVVFISFLCSLLEATFLSISPAFVAVAVSEKKRSGLLLEHLKENSHRPLSAILTLNTIAHTMGASFIGAQVHEIYGSTAVTVFSVIFTLAILIISEIIPKILGHLYWKNLAALAAYTIQVMIFALFPIVKLSELLGKLFGESDNATVTREEMIMNAEIGVEEGSLHKKESNVIKNLLMLNNIFVSDIMTPRSVFFALDGSMTVEEVHNKYKPIRFSRIPIYRETLDQIIGMTFRYKIHEALSNDQHSLKLEEITRPINSVSEGMTVAGVIDYFVKKKEHLALAVDEYGVITGLVTLEDAIETLLGVEIVDELDTVTDMRQFALEQWQIRKNQFRNS